MHRAGVDDPAEALAVAHRVQALPGPADGRTVRATRATARWSWTTRSATRSRLPRCDYFVERRRSPRGERRPMSDPVGSGHRHGVLDRGGSADHRAPAGLLRGDGRLSLPDGAPVQEGDLGRGDGDQPPQGSARAQPRQEDVRCGRGRERPGLPAASSVTRGSSRTASTRSTRPTRPTHRARSRSATWSDFHLGYTPFAVNYFDAYHVVEGGKVVDIWPILPRGPLHGGLLQALEAGR